MLSSSISSQVALPGLSLAYVSAFLWMCILNPPQDKIVGFYGYVIEGLFTLTFSTMIVVLTETVLKVVIAFIGLLTEHRSSMENAVASYYTAAKEEILNETKRQRELHNAQMDVCTTMTSLLKLRIENHASLNNIQAKCESETGSDVSVNSNDDHITSNPQKSDQAKPGGPSSVFKEDSTLSTASTTR